MNQARGSRKGFSEETKMITSKPGSMMEHGE
jgi:hypothetical protein